MPLHVHTPPAVTTAEIDHIRGEHWKVCNSLFPEPGICVKCRTRWPCDAHQVLTRLDAVTAGQTDWQDSYEMVRDQVLESFNPPDDDEAEEAIICRAVEVGASFIRDQECTCPASPDEAPCPRCRVLGRYQDESVPR